MFDGIDCADEDTANGSDGPMQAAMAARRKKMADARSVGAEQETASESREQLSQHREVQMHTEGTLDRALAEASDQNYKLEQELCRSLRHEVAAAVSAKEKADSIVEAAAGQMEQLKDRCLQLQELVRSLQAELFKNQSSGKEATTELCQHQLNKSQCSQNMDLQETEPQPEPSHGSSDAQLRLLTPCDDSFEEAMTPALSERCLQDECDELRRLVSNAALAEKREQDTAEMHQDQVRRLQRSVQRLQEQARKPRYAFHEAAMAATAESKKQGVQRIKRLQDYDQDGESSSDFLFV